MKIGTLVKFLPEEQEYITRVQTSGSIGISFVRQPDKIPEEIARSDRSQLRKSDQLNIMSGHTYAPSSFPNMSGSIGIVWETNMQPVPNYEEMGVVLEEATFDEVSYCKIHWQKLNDSTWLDIRDVTKVG